MMPTTDDAALVLFSGGQDSTTCLAWALDRFSRVDTVGFDYGQTHRVELECRSAILAALRTRFPDWSAKLGADHEMNLDVLGQISPSALTGDAPIVVPTSGLPSTFVPGRNLLFLTFAATIAYRRGIKRLVGGMCETDYSGYPDCRDDALKALQVALNLGMEARFVVETPLMWLDKAATWRLARDLGGPDLIDVIRRETHTCYRGDRSRLHDWGFGCGTCPACELRRQGYERFLATA